MDCFALRFVPGKIYAQPDPRAALGAALDLFTMSFNLVCDNPHEAREVAETALETAGELYKRFYDLREQEALLTEVQRRKQRARRRMRVVSRTEPKAPTAPAGTLRLVKGGAR